MISVEDRASPISASDPGCQVWGRVQVREGHQAVQRPVHQTYTLITRLHHNVIKTAVKTISLAYSKITFADIAEKLHLDSPEDAEFIVAKAIRDGVIEAELDHRQGIMQSKDTSDVYSTREPQIAFNQRIEFCLDLHNNLVSHFNCKSDGQ